MVCFKKQELTLAFFSKNTCVFRDVKKKKLSKGEDIVFGKPSCEDEDGVEEEKEEIKIEERTEDDEKEKSMISEKGKEPAFKANKSLEVPVPQRERSRSAEGRDTQSTETNVNKTVDDGPHIHLTLSSSAGSPGEIRNRNNDIKRVYLGKERAVGSGTRDVERVILSTRRRHSSPRLARVKKPMDLFSNSNELNEENSSHSVLTPKDFLQLRSNKEKNSIFERSVEKTAGPERETIFERNVEQDILSGTNDITRESASKLGLNTDSINNRGCNSTQTNGSGGAIAWKSSVPHSRSNEEGKPRSATFAGSSSLLKSRADGSSKDRWVPAGRPAAFSPSSRSDVTSSIDTSSSSPTTILGLSSSDSLPSSPRSHPLSLSSDSYLVNSPVTASSPLSQSVGPALSSLKEQPPQQSISTFLVSSPTTLSGKKRSEGSLILGAAHRTAPKSIEETPDSSAPPVKGYSICINQPHFLTHLRFHISHKGPLRERSQTSIQPAKRNSIWTFRSSKTRTYTSILPPPAVPPSGMFN